MSSVLIVDDSVENINSLRAILERDYEIYISTSGEMSLRVMKQVLPDIILLDVFMPGLSGFDVFREMKKDKQLEAIPVIFVTGSNDESDETQGVKDGAVDYIHKPYNAEIIYLKVKNHIINKMNRDNLEHLVKLRTAELNASRQAVIMGMSMLAEGRDNDTGNHLKRMQQYTKILAYYISNKYPDLLSKPDADSIILYSPLHDIGKVSIPDSILLKQGRLTDEEFRIMKNHTVFGAEVLVKTDNLMGSADDKGVETVDDLDMEFNKNYIKMSGKLLNDTANSTKVPASFSEKNEGSPDVMKTLRVAIEICESHHEKFDGTGYPSGRKGLDIPLSARIVALADIYDALTSVRPYKKAFTHQEAYEIIVVGDGRTKPEHFSPEVLEAFVNTHHRFKELATKLAD